MAFFKSEQIITRVQYCIKNKKPFSLIRFGDGGMKFIHSIYYNDKKLIKHISTKEGIPENKFIDVLELWGYYGRRADVIDCNEIYFSEYSWPRNKRDDIPMSKQTLMKMKNWKFYYSQAEIDNNNFCHPDYNFICAVYRRAKKDIFTLLRGRKICIITNHKQVKSKLEKICDVEIIPIVGFYENQYNVCYHSVVEIIKQKAKDYDLWLNASGELGRIYSGMIKENGGRVLDVGSLIDYWVTGKITNRLGQYLIPHHKNKLKLILTQAGEKYEPYL